MEDFSKDLKRKIIRSRPFSRRRNPEKQVLIVDSYGGVKSGSRLLFSVKVALMGLLACLVAASVLFVRSGNIFRENRQMASRIKELESRLQILTREKERLLVRQAMTGDAVVKTDSGESAAGLAQTAAGEQPFASQEVAATEQGGNLQPDADVSEGRHDVGSRETKVDIENFSMNWGKGDLQVKFDIRNASGETQVSGHIFIILKPDGADQTQWRVVPHSPLENSLPVAFRKGQEFSIARFKPVKFRIRDISGQPVYTKASVVVFDTRGNPILKSDIDIGEENSE